ncbi:hypothetical protein LOAG_11939, partial [Loa loa]
MEKRIAINDRKGGNEALLSTPLVMTIFSRTMCIQYDPPFPSNELYKPRSNID